MLDLKLERTQNSDITRLRWGDPLKNRVVLVLVAVGCIFSADAEAQALLDNPDFATDISYWTCTAGGGTTIWGALDADGANDSGSLRIDNDAPANNAFLACTQCVPVEEANRYRLSTSVYLAGAPNVTLDGSARIRVAYYSNASCTDVLEYAGMAIAHDFLSSENTWFTLENEWSLAPPGTTHALVTLTCWADKQYTPQRMHFDNVLLDETPAIFADGFEFGNLDAWSSTVG